MRNGVRLCYGERKKEPDQRAHLVSGGGRRAGLRERLGARLGRAMQRGREWADGLWLGQRPAKEDRAGLAGAEGSAGPRPEQRGRESSGLEKEMGRAERNGAGQKQRKEKRFILFFFQFFQSKFEMKF